MKYKSVIVYYSRFGHTQRIAQAVGDVLSSAGEAQVLPVDQVTAASLEGVNLVVMGSPTHRMRMPKEVQPLFDALPRRALRGAAVAAFDTSYHTSRFLAHFTAAKTLAHKLRRLGGKPAAPPQTFFMAAREGPLEDGEIERAKVWAGTLLAQLPSRKAD